MYVTKVSVKRFSPYIHFYGLAAYCSQLCNDMLGLDLLLTKKEIILAIN